MENGTIEIIRTAMNLAAEKGWRHITLYDIAAETRKSPADIIRATGGKHGILPHLFEHVNECLATDTDPDILTVPPRERVFDLMMRRLETLEEFKPGLKAVFADLKKDPVDAAGLLPPLGKSMMLMLELAGLSSSHCGKDMIKATVLAAIHLKVMHVWAEDDSPDNAHTMAELDRHLGKLESFVGKFTKRKKWGD